MMTSRAEYRINLRQDTADFRLTPKIEDTPLFTEERKKSFDTRVKLYEQTINELNRRADRRKAERFLAEKTIAGSVSAVTYADLIRRGGALKDICAYFDILNGVPDEILKTAEASVKYEGYLKKNSQQIEKAKKLEEKAIPADIDYDEIKGLRLEAREQLKRVRPLTLGQAGRIYGVNPADVTVLIVWLATRKN